jgi:hypothetical protein
MKKVTLLLAAFTGLLSINATAQLSSKVENLIKEYRLGVYVGVGSTSLKPKSSDENNYTIAKNGGKIATSIGLMAEKNFDDRYAVYSGIGMDWSGGAIKSDIKNPALNDSSFAKFADVKYKLQHVTIPIGVKMKAANIENIRVFVQVGADLGLLIGKKADYTMAKNTVLAQTESKENIKLKGLKVSPIQLGWQFGVGAEYALKSKNAVTASLVYHNAFLPDLTFSKEFKDALKAQYKFEDGKVTANTIALRIGYFF